MKALDITEQITLDCTGDCVHIRCGKLLVNVHRTDEGVIADIWPTYPDGDWGVEPIASTYSFFTEADEGEES